MPDQPTRRSFLATAALAAAGPMIVPGRVLGLDGTVAPSNRIVVGGIGIGPRGQEVLGAFLRQPDVQFVEVCDVQQSRRNYVKGLVNGHYGNRDCRTTRDLHETLARADIDAVLVATGDRWHSLATVLAAKAGKDIYCEKPCALTMGECREMAEAVRRYGRVFQAGTQRRNVPNFRHAAGLARSGRLGRIQAVHASIYALGSANDWLPAEPEPDPEVVDWDRWLGPAPWRPFNPRYVQGGWRSFADFSAGAQLLDWGAHTVDLCQWAVDADETTPVEIEPDGGTVNARYGNGVRLVMRLGGFSGEGNWLGLGTCPVRFEGDQGWVETGDSGEIKAEPASLLADAPPGRTAGTDPTGHVRDFLDCTRTRSAPASNADVMRHGHVACHAAAISWLRGRKLRFDPESESFPDDPEANRLRTRAKRSPWHA